VPRRFPFGVIGVFVLLLGAGVILDGDRTVAGTVMIVTGAALMVLESRQP
jgi:hypothetical protein